MRMSVGLGRLVIMIVKVMMRMGIMRSGEDPGPDSVHTPSLPTPLSISILLWAVSVVVFYMTWFPDSIILC